MLLRRNVWLLYIMAAPISDGVDYKSYNVMPDISYVFNDSGNAFSF